MSGTCRCKSHPLLALQAHPWPPPVSSVAPRLVAGSARSGPPVAHRLAGPLSKMLLTAVLMAACGAERPSGVLVGQSPHFRLYVSPRADVPAGLEGEAALTALERNWADVATLLPLPDGRIDYYWLHASEGSSCGEGMALAGCALPGPVVISRVLPDQHELNHAYFELLGRVVPIPLLAEGAAEAIGCGQGATVPLADNVRWQDVVALTPKSPGSDALYGQGALLVRHLIRTRGSAAFISYYKQAPVIRNLARFADNFARFWQMSLDDAWSAMKAPGPGDSTVSTALCPCSLPPLPIDGVGALVNDPGTTPYWVVPDVAGKTIAFHSPVGKGLRIFDCLGTRSDAGGSGGAQVGLARLAADREAYVSAPVDRAVAGNFISDTCAEAAPFTVPAGIVDHEIDVRVSRSTASSADVYLLLQAPPGASTLTAWHGAVSACATCAFDTPDCQPGSSVSARGTYYVRLPLSDVPSNSADVTFNALLIR